MTPLNILIFEPYPFGKEAGNLRTQSYILEFVDKTKYNLILLAPFETDFTKRVRNQGFECVIVTPPQRVLRYGRRCLRDNFVGRFLTMLDMVVYNMKLLAVIKKKKIAVIYSNCIRGALSIGLAAKFSRTPHLWYIKGELENRLLDMIGFALADKILFFCESNKHDKHPNLVKRYEKKIDILKIGINPATIIEIEQRDKATLTKELFIDQQHTYILYLGQLYAPKGVHYLLEAIGLTVKDFPDIKLYIVGDPILDEYMEYKEKLVHIVKQYKLTDTVVFTGWRTDALEILSLMDIFFKGGLWQGSPGSYGVWKTCSGF
jgi:glycosyltransferase involved in cell wall biosynthesis